MFWIQGDGVWGPRETLFGIQGDGVWDPGRTRFGIQGVVFGMHLVTRFAHKMQDFVTMGQLSDISHISM